MTLIKCALVLDSIGSFQDADKIEKLAVKRHPGISWGVPRDLSDWEQMKNILGIAYAMQKVLKTSPNEQNKEWARNKLNEYRNNVKRVTPALLKIPECRPFLEALSTVDGYEFIMMYDSSLDPRQPSLDFD